jgi:hypothetical protein
MSTDTLSRFQALSPAAQEQLLAQLTAAPAAPTPAPGTRSAAPESYYDMDAAVPVTFKAKLSPSPKARDKSYAERFDHIWVKGHYQVVGPKGGQYCVGRVVLGVKKGQQVKGILRISNAKFLELQAGGTVDGWMRPDDSKDSVLLGELSGYQAV